MKLELITEFRDTSKDAEREKETAGKTTGSNDMGQWVSTEQAAEIMGVSAARVRQFVMDGRLTPHQPTDSDNYYKRADVEALAKKPRERTGRPKGSKNED